MRTNVCIADGSYAFRAIVKGDLVSVADALVASLEGRAVLQPGLVMTRFLRGHPGACLAPGPLDGQDSVYMAQTDNDDILVRVVRGCRTAFSGPPWAFPKWARGWREPEGLVGKDVVFRYTNGSGVGNRHVRVESVSRKNGRTYYHGVDLQKGEHRQYDSQYIDGEILVVG